jgi:hypothetical protein
MPHSANPIDCLPKGAGKTNRFRDADCTVMREKYVY